MQPQEPQRAPRSKEPHSIPSGTVAQDERTLWFTCQKCGDMITPYEDTPTARHGVTVVQERCGAHVFNVRRASVQAPQEKTPLRIGQDTTPLNLSRHSLVLSMQTHLGLDSCQDPSTRKHKRKRTRAPGPRCLQSSQETANTKSTGPFGGCEGATAVVSRVNQGTCTEKTLTGGA